MKLRFLIFTMLFSAGFSLLASQDPTPDFEASRVWARLNLNIEKETKEVHFISTNNDPDVLTKTYVLKHADPYELRPYIKNCVQARRVNTDDTKVEAIKYEDGTNILIVSAEDYRFEQQDYGMGIDEIISILDQPKVSSSSGHKLYLYFPKYWDSTSLRTVIMNVGLCNSNSPYELQGGKDRVSADVGLNALFFYTPAYSIKTVEEMLKLYDTPTAEALLTYTIYEIYTENDGQIGADFQAWKNGPGSDLFAVASRYTNGWNIENMGVETNPWIGRSHSRFINFSPKWNSKYLDFLVAKSKAKIVNSGTLSIMNNTEGYIANTTRLASIEDGAAFDSRATINEYQRLTDVNWQVDNDSDAANNNRYRINNAVDEKGNTISIGDSENNFVNAAMDFVITRSTVGDQTYYYMQIDQDADAFFFDFQGQNLGKTVRAYNVELERCLRTSQGVSNGAVVYTYSWTDQTNWQTDRSLTVLRDVQRDTKVNSYGFTLTMKPVVCENATTLGVHMTNTSLIGFQDNGKPRTAKSEVETTVMVSNKGQKFFIGGLNKQQLVRSVSKVPWLGSIPVLGWAFSTESEVMKKSQLVAVIECVPIMPDTKVPAEIMSSINQMKEKVDNYGVHYGVIDENDYGFDQFLLDKDKTSLAPLP